MDHASSPFSTTKDPIKENQPKAPSNQFTVLWFLEYIDFDVIIEGFLTSTVSVLHSGLGAPVPIPYPLQVVCDLGGIPNPRHPKFGINNYKYKFMGIPKRGYMLLRWHWLIFKLCGSFTYIFDGKTSVDSRGIVWRPWWTLRRVDPSSNLGGFQNYCGFTTQLSM